MLKYECDSRKVKTGQTFVAIKGLTVDGHDFIDKAIENGAKQIICEKELSNNQYINGVPYVKVDSTDKYLKNALNLEYGEIINELNIIGITGTNGKTTSCYLIYQMLLSLGINASYIGTLGYYHKDDFIELNNTTPDVLTIYDLLVRSRQNGAEVVVMEVSSQALSYDRLAGINFSLIGFTNLTEDHLDYHKTMENYLNAKLMILDHLKKNAKIIVNSDDENHIKFKKDKHEFIRYGTNGEYKILDYKITPSETELNFEYSNKKYNVTIPLTSKFNVYNYLMMLSTIHEYGIDIEKIIKKTPSLEAPKGRCETYKVKNGFAIIDYAHTPDAVEKVITAYNELKNGKVITIFGCGGDRDAKKRPIMGEIATRLSDHVIITSDNPRTEDPFKIIEDIKKGIKKDNYEVIEDRKKAIEKGIDLLNKNDILLILGKGHENYQIIGKTKYHLDDSEEVLNYNKK